MVPKLDPCGTPFLQFKFKYYVNSFSYYSLNPSANKNFYAFRVTELVPPGLLSCSSFWTTWAASTRCTSSRLIHSLISSTSQLIRVRRVRTWKSELIIWMTIIPTPFTGTQIRLLVGDAWFVNHNLKSGYFGKSQVVKVIEMSFSRCYAEVWSRHSSLWKPMTIIIVHLVVVKWFPWEIPKKVPVEHYHNATQNIAFMYIDLNDVIIFAALFWHSNYKSRPKAFRSELTKASFHLKAVNSFFIGVNRLKFFIFNIFVAFPDTLAEDYLRSTRCSSASKCAPKSWNPLPKSTWMSTTSSFVVEWWVE